jgi:hypothetical protein
LFNYSYFFYFSSIIFSLFLSYFGYTFAIRFPRGVPSPFSPTFPFTSSKTTLNDFACSTKLSIT